MGSKRKKINYKISAFLFILKAILLTVYVKIFFKNKLKNSYENCCLSLYPNFYKNTSENFFKQKYLKLNFVIADEVLTSSNFVQKIFIIKKLQNVNDLVIVEKFISLRDLISKFLRIYSLNNEIKCIDKEKIFYNKIDISDVINDYAKISLYNAFKFEIYENSLFISSLILFLLKCFNKLSPILIPSISNSLSSSALIENCKFKTKKNINKINFFIVN